MPPRALDFYYSFRSPYSYLAIGRVAALRRRYELDVRVRIVRPIAVRIPGFFKTVNPLWPPYLIRDTRRIAERLRIPYAWPVPDPIRTDMATGDVAADQPYIMRVSRMGVAAARDGLGLEFLASAGRTIWSGRIRNWHEPPHLSRAARTAGLDPDALETRIAAEAESFDAEIAKNETDQVAAGHWGVPLLVVGGEPFFGQDRFEDLRHHLGKIGVPLRPRS